MPSPTEFLKGTQNPFKHIFRKTVICSTLLLEFSLRVNSKRGGVNGSVDMNDVA